MDAGKQESEVLTFSCPSCGEPMTTAAESAQETESVMVEPSLPFAGPPQKTGRGLKLAFLGMSWDGRILGAVSLLVLSGLVIYLVRDKKESSYIERQRIHNKIAHSDYFTGLVAGGTVDPQAMEAVEGLRPYGSGFIGLSKEKLAWAEALGLAERTGGEILDIQLTAQERRKDLTGLLTESYPEQHGETVWVRDNGRSKVIDSPDVLQLGNTGAAEMGSRRVFLRWPRTETWKAQGWSWTIPPQFDQVTPFSPWGLARVRTGKWWGLIDEAGRTVLAPIFDRVETFSDYGSARVHKDGKWGSLDRTGKQVAPMEWEEVQDLIQGFLPVRRDGKWGYLNAAGKLIVPCVWDDAWRFSAEGFAVVTRSEKRGIIDRSGKVIVEPVWDGAVNFSKEGLGIVRRGPGWGVIDTSGRLLCEPVWKTAWKNRRFDLGFLPVWKQEMDNLAPGRRAPHDPFGETASRDLKHASTPGAFALLGMDAKPLPGTESDAVTNSAAGIVLKMMATEGGSEGSGQSLDLPKVQDELEGAGDESRILGAQGSLLFKVPGKLGDYSEGLAIVTAGQQSGAVDLKGNWVASLQPGSLRAFKNGFAAGEFGGKWGFMDRAGKFVVKQEWDAVLDFSEGRAAVRRGDKWGLVDEAGRVISEPKWSAVGKFSEGLAAVKPMREEVPEPEKVGILRRMRFRETEALKQWQSLTPQEKQEAWKQQAEYESNGQKWKFIDLDGKPALGSKSWKPLDYSGGPPQFRDGYFRAFGEGRSVVYVDSKGRESKTVWDGIRLPPGLTIIQNAGSGRYLNRLGEAGTSTTLMGAAGEVMMPEVEGKADFLSDFIPYAEPAKFGLMNAAGNLLREPLWDGVWILSPTQVKFLVGKKYGLANGMGKVIIEAKWDELEVLPVNSGSLGQDGKSVKLGLGGGEILSPWVRVKDGDKTLILRPDGVPAIPETLTGAEYVDFYGPSQIVVTQPSGENGKLWSVYEPAKGKQVKFPKARTFRWNWNTAAAGVLWMQDNTTAKWRLMSREGVDFGHAQPEEKKPDGWVFVEGRGRLHTPDGWMFVDTGIKSISEERWEQSREFSEGLAAVRREGKWGFVGIDGRLVIPCVWDETGDFSRGLAAVRRAGLWGYMDGKGALVIEPVWDVAGSFEPWLGEPGLDGVKPEMNMAQVKIQGFTAVIDRKGSLLVDPTRKEVRKGAALINGAEELILMKQGDAAIPVTRVSGSDDRVEVSPARFWQQRGGATSRQSQGGWMLMDERGKALTPPDWRQPEDGMYEDPLAGGLLHLRSEDGFYGLIRRDGTTAVAPRFDRITWVAPKVAAVWSRTEGGLIDAAGAWIFQDTRKVRIARFLDPIPDEPDPQFRHGLVVIEDVPRWGFARLNR